MKPCLLLLYLGSLAASCAQEFAPVTVTNSIVTIFYSNNLIPGNVSVLHASNGLAYGVNSGGPLGNSFSYKWTKTGPNTGTLQYGFDPGSGQTTLTFRSAISGNSQQQTLGAGIFAFSPFPLSAYAPLSNLSTRAVLTANQATSVGFVVGGSATRRVLVRAIGPSLAQFGVSNVEANPVLSVYRGGVQIGTNSGWGGAASLTAVFASVGAFTLPATSRDCALVLTLAPGGYTALVRADAGGEVLVEVYFID